MFYKMDESMGLIAGCGVYSPTYILVPENLEIYNFPVDGWYYFATRAEALTFFGITEEAPNGLQNL